MYGFIRYNCINGNLNLSTKKASQDALAETLTFVLTSAVAACLVWSPFESERPPLEMHF